MLPQFPQFKKIDLSDRTDIEAHTNLFEPYSDFNFTCLWAWDTEEERLISVLNDNLVVRFTDYVTDKPFLSFLGVNDCENTTRSLIEYSAENYLPTTLRLMPDKSIFNISPTVFTIEEDQGDFDYIYSVPELATLKGNKYMSKRGRVNRFWRENPSIKIRHLPFNDIQVQQQIFEVIDTWKSNKTVMNKDYVIAHELKAIKRLCVSNMESLFVIGLFLEEKMIGYIVSEVLSRDYSILHFMKCDISYVGSSEALMQAFAIHLDSLSVEYMNFESDLCVEAMRQTKKSWRPIKFLKRYNVRYAQS